MIIRKIQWYTWDGNKLVIQSVSKQITEENNKVIESIPLGSVKYTFTNIDTKEKVDNIIEEITSGKIK